MQPQQQKTQTETPLQRPIEELENEFTAMEENMTETNDDNLISLVETFPIDNSAKIKFLVKKLRSVDRQLNDNIRGQQMEQIRNRP